MSLAGTSHTSDVLGIVVFDLTFLNEWPEDRPDYASPKSPDELVAMIQFEGKPALQDALRAFCREFIDIFDSAVCSLLAKVDAMVEIDRSKWELPQNRLP